ncbi:MAG: hypothetical protein NTX65_14150 [Ignavibacteriales bacterium]|nr:hypothetical protein [Ignavibacteriales bacterium]
MTIKSKRKITSAFMIGYFTSLLKNEMTDEETESNHDQNFLIMALNTQIFTTMSDLHKDIFGEEFPRVKFIECIDDLKVTLCDLNEMISEKIQRGGESFLEISFLCGGFLGLTEATDSLPHEIQKLEIIVYHLLNKLDVNLCWNDLEKIINDLTSGEIQLRRNSRDQLFSMICGSHTKHQTIYEFQNLFERNSSVQHFAFA